MYPDSTVDYNILDSFHDLNSHIENFASTLLKANVEDAFWSIVSYEDLIKFDGEDLSNWHIFHENRIRQSRKITIYIFIGKCNCLNLEVLQFS